MSKTIKRLECELDSERKDAERYRYLRNRVPADALGRIKAAAGCWIDCHGENGELVLLTCDDADIEIDTAMAAVPTLGAA